MLSVAVATLCVVIAAVPLWWSRRHMFLNPGTLVLPVVLWSTVLKALYIKVIRPEPLKSVHDPIYVAATSSEFILQGLLVVALAMCFYAIGNSPIARRLSQHAPGAGLKPPKVDTSRSQTVLAVLVGGCLVAFLVYLQLSGNSLFELPFSEKRFRPGEMGVSSRFFYIPYYFFKMALTSGSVAYAAAVFLVVSGGTIAERCHRRLLIISFALILLIAHFASLRLFLLLTFGQIALLLVYFRGRGRMALVVILAMLTIGSNVLVTFVHRAPLPRRVLAPEDPRVSERAPQASIGEADQPEPQPGTAASRSARSSASDESGSWWLRKGAAFSRAAFEGRYFLDAAKLSHLRMHFPERQSFQWGGTFIGRRISPPDAVASNADVPLRANRYLPLHVFAEPVNNVPPGYAGELYINFGLSGVALGFLLLGMIHRKIYESLASKSPSVLYVAILIILSLNSSLVLLNSGVVPAIARSLIDVTIVTAVWYLSARTSERYHGAEMADRRDVQIT